MDERTTRELTPIQIEVLLEDERTDDSDQCAHVPAMSTAAPVPAPQRRLRKRTERMRVFNFKPLPHPHTEEVTTTPRSASTSKASRLKDVATSFFTAFVPRRG